MQIAINPLIGTAVLGLCALLAAWLDVVSRRLPNWLCLLTALGGFGFVAATLGAGPLAWAAAHSVLALIIGMALFHFGWIGGGDAKFYAACAAWFPLSSALTMLLLVSVAGLILVIGWFGYRQVSRARQPGDKSPFAQVPYGLAIGFGTVLAWASMP